MQSTLYSSDKYSYIRDQQLAAREKGVDYLLPGEQPPLLKPEHDVKRQGTVLAIPPLDKPPPPPPAAREESAAPVPAPPVPKRQSEAESADFGFGNK